MNTNKTKRSLFVFIFVFICHLRVFLSGEQRLTMEKHFLIGMDVGSTTVKAVVIDAATDEILWRDYQRHDTKQPEKVLEFCKRFDTEIEGFEAERSRMFITGSGGNGMAQVLGAKFVQEVNAVSLAVEKLYPECGSVIELGGQDAKIIIFKDGPGDRPQEEDPVDERQVRRRHRRSDRQDQRQAAHSGRAALPDGLQGRQAASGRRQVRRLRRDRYQRPAENGRSARRADGLAVRGDRHAEPLGADARQHAPAR